jgi:hypothetical protein
MLYDNLPCLTRMHLILKQYPVNACFLGISKVSLPANHLLNPGFEFPACHLPQRQPPGEFIRRNFLPGVAYFAGNVKCLAYREFAVMEYGSRCGRFLSFALRTPPGEGRLPRAIILIPAFPAPVSFAPFKLRQKLKTLFITLKKFLSNCRPALFFQ